MNLPDAAEVVFLFLMEDKIALCLTSPEELLYEESDNGISSHIGFFSEFFPLYFLL